MIKSIFVDPLDINGIENSGANHLIVTLDHLTLKVWEKLRLHTWCVKLDLAICITALEQGDCPASPKAFDQLAHKLQAALTYKAAEIWLDHFRFDGSWEQIKGSQIPNLHADCKWCRGKDRVQILLDHLNKAKQYIGHQAKLGYFAVPFRSEEVPQLTSSLGQDHSILGKIFDASSPMFYHRMIGKPTTYISEFVSWMHQQTKKPILPIIQIKDMPDNLEDRLTKEEITQAFKEAQKPPSEGVCFFNWTQAQQMQKSSIIHKLFTTP
ncbi:hypothetical protein HYS94_01100 [Candidatus Daviesbacteria bacterium]|nr:hypothetical protein [Candidatus Daviesbacteria bacterium]